MQHLNFGTEMELGHASPEDFFYYEACEVSVTFPQIYEVEIQDCHNANSRHGPCAKNEPCIYIFHQYRFILLTAALLLKWRMTSQFMEMNSSLEEER